MWLHIQCRLPDLFATPVTPEGIYSLWSLVSGVVRGSNIRVLQPATKERPVHHLHSERIRYSVPGLLCRLSTVLTMHQVALLNIKNMAASHRLLDCRHTKSRLNTAVSVKSTSPTNGATDRRLGGSSACLVPTPSKVCLLSQPGFNLGSGGLASRRLTCPRGHHAVAAWSMPPNRQRRLLLLSDSYRALVDSNRPEQWRGLQNSGAAAWSPALTRHQSRRPAGRGASSPPRQPHAGSDPPGSSAGTVRRREPQRLAQAEGRP